MQINQEVCPISCVFAVHSGHLLVLTYWVDCCQALWWVSSQDTAHLDSQNQHLTQDHKQLRKKKPEVMTYKFLSLWLPSCLRPEIVASTSPPIMVE